MCPGGMLPGLQGTEPGRAREEPLGCAGLSQQQSGGVCTHGALGGVSQTGPLLCCDARRCEGTQAVLPPLFPEQVKAAGALCRASKNDCDLAEHCSGLSAECPEDVFQENGISCQHGSGYCYNGACPSHGEQCRALWGAGTAPSPTSLPRDVPGAPRASAAPRVTLAVCPAEAQVAPDVCFKHNSEQHVHLHCLTEYGKQPCSPK